MCLVSASVKNPLDFQTVEETAGVCAALRLCVTLAGGEHWDFSAAIKALAEVDLRQNPSVGSSAAAGVARVARRGATASRQSECLASLLSLHCGN